MDVQVNEARRDDQPGSVESFDTVGRDAFGNFGDSAIADEQVALCFERL